MPTFRLQGAQTEAKSIYAVGQNTGSLWMRMRDPHSRLLVWVCIVGKGGFAGREGDFIIDCEISATERLDVGSVIEITA